MKSTFRGRFHDHVLHVDAVNKTLKLGDGDETTFNGSEEDLVIYSVDGRSLYLDVTQIEPEFVGEIQVGVMGIAREVRETVLFQ